MSNLANILGKSYFVKVEHLQADSGNSNQEGFVLDLSLQAVNLNIQPSTPEMMALNGGAFGKAFTSFTTCSGILETDRLTVVSGTLNPAPVYIVRGKQDFNYGYAQHIELYLELIV